MDPDAAFLELFERTGEFDPGDKEYPSYRAFNVTAVERGRTLVEWLETERPLEGQRALDIGCGSGGLAIALAEYGARVDAIEPDPVRHAWAAARIAGHRAAVELHRASAERLPFADGTFALVTLDAVIEHVEDTAATIREVGRVLGPGGIAYILSPNKASVLNIVHDPHYRMLGVVLMPRRLGKLYVERIRRHERGYWVNHIPTKRWLRRELRRAGLSPELVVPPGFEKLRTPEAIRHPVARRAAVLAQRLGLASALPRLALAQYPTLTLLARKPS